MLQVPIILFICTTLLRILEIHTWEEYASYQIHRKNYGLLILLKISNGIFVMQYLSVETLQQRYFQILQRSY